MTSLPEEKWSTQINKGYLELCVLVYLRKHKEAYGAHLRNELKKHEIMVNEGTLYPLLSRMHGNGWLSFYWQTENESGHPRKIYQLKENQEPIIDRMIAIYLENTQKLKGMIG